MKTIDEFLSLLKNVKIVRPNEWKSCCPSHNDGQEKGHESLSIKVVDDKILVKCFACCDTRDIVKTLGLTMSDLYLGEKKYKPRSASRRTPRTIDITYPYYNAGNVLVFEVVRYKPKYFSQRRPDGNGGFINDIKGCERVIYRLPQVLAAIGRGDTIYHCEGEKDADNLVKLVMEATTSPMGAAAWKPEQAKYFTGARQVVIIPDKDRAGMAYAREVATDIFPHVGSVIILELPGKDIKDVSDWLAAGGTRDQLVKLVVAAAPWSPPKGGTGDIDYDAVNKLLKQASNGQYCIIDGKFNRVVHTKEGDTNEYPLCNFVARISEDLYKDDGAVVHRFLTIQGRLNSSMLPRITIPEAQYDSMKWPRREWGFKAQTEHSRSNNDHLINAIDKASGNVAVRTIYTHTGWRNINGKMVYLTGGGAIGMPGIEVELPQRLTRYRLPQPEGDPKESVRKSLDMMLIASPNVTVPTFILPYLSVLNIFEDMDFTVWYLGRSGSLKSVMTALALSHFGDFTYKSLPVNWFGTRTELEKLSFWAKDALFAIDDYAPPLDANGSREINRTVEYMIRAYGNRQGKVRSNADLSSQETFYPRGLLVTSGEQLPPPGVSRSARILPVHISLADFISDGDENLYMLTQAQKDRVYYPMAMAHFIKWVQDNWDAVKASLSRNSERYSTKLPKREVHLRLVAAVALMQSGLDIITEFALDTKTITSSEKVSLVNTGRSVLNGLLSSQSSHIKSERPGQRFIEVLKSLLSSGRAELRHQNDTLDWYPNLPGPGQSLVGWDSITASAVYLNPAEAYSLVFSHCRRIDEYFGTHKDETWRDIQELGYLLGVDKDDTPTVVKSFGGVKTRVLPINRSVIFPEEEVVK